MRRKPDTKPTRGELMSLVAWLLLDCGLLEGLTLEQARELDKRMRRQKPFVPRGKK